MACPSQTTLSASCLDTPCDGCEYQMMGGQDYMEVSSRGQEPWAQADGSYICNADHLKPLLLLLPHHVGQYVLKISNNWCWYWKSIVLVPIMVTLWPYAALMKLNPHTGQSLSTGNHNQCKSMQLFRAYQDILDFIQICITADCMMIVRVRMLIKAAGRQDLLGS